MVGAHRDRWTSTKRQLTKTKYTPHGQSTWKGVTLTTDSRHWGKGSRQLISLTRTVRETDVLQSLQSWVPTNLVALTANVIEDKLQNNTTRVGYSIVLT